MQFVITIVLRQKAVVVDCRTFGLGRKEESIFGIDVGICALHDWGRGPSARGFAEGKRRMCLSAWP